MSTCSICPRSADDGQHACPRHAAELRAWLTELPRQEKLLSLFLAPASRPHAGRLGGTGRATAPVPVDLRVLNLLVGPGHYEPVPGSDDDGQPPIAARLGAWAGHIAYHYPAATRDPYGTAHTVPCAQAWPRRGGETITGWCNWLLAYLPYALTLPLIADFHRQLGDLIDHVRDLTHAVPRRHYMTAPCPGCGEFDLARTDGQDGVTCQDCGHHLTLDAYDEHAARLLRAYQEGAAADGAAA
ncbi:hypothetical protein [Streptomyces sp. TRM68416]|uniref:hypothetical protein n=1 Tax=Streptomyces sp. TRM68416 TaxID=2758412 RepID=UPI001661F156|nr:hypothetical protein [Streptomyces sp. TRM68416]MBD0837388.1 hypothetical protein [Streptomyces sp. TRM68416]